MILAATDWTVLGVGLVTAGASIVGGAVGAWIQGRHARDAAETNRVAGDRVVRRDAYIDLLKQIDAMKALIDGSMMLGRPFIGGKGERSEPLLTAAVTAEFYAPAPIWARMKPLVTATMLLTNWATLSTDGMPTERVWEAIREIGVDEPAGWERLRDDYLNAARQDVGE